MEIVLRVLQVFLAIGLIGVVLLQRSEGGGLGIGSSGGAGSFMSVRGTANFLTRVTAILAALFMITCLILALLAKPNTAPKSIFDGPAPGTTAPGTTAPGTTAPAPTPAPLIPPPAAPAAPASEAPALPVPVPGEAPTTGATTSPTTAPAPVLVPPPAATAPVTPAPQPAPSAEKVKPKKAPRTAPAHAPGQ